MALHNLEQTLLRKAKEEAEAIVAEWQAQQDQIDPTTMPLTRLANSVIDAVQDRVAAVRDDVAKYFESDLLFYRASFPAELVAREAEHLAKVLADAEKARQALNQKPAKLTADDQPAVGKPVLPSGLVGG